MDCAECEELDAAFPGMLDRIAEEITEQTWDRNRCCPAEAEHDGDVCVTDVQAINACNHVIVGSFWLGGVEYSFEAESGDRCGWVWRSISSDDPIPSIEIHHTKWALQPSREIIDKAVMTGTEKFLLAKWDALRFREPYVSMPSKYAYDRHFQPGLQLRASGATRQPKEALFLWMKKPLMQRASACQNRNH
jgi:hypothetical protein